MKAVDQKALYHILNRLLSAHQVPRRIRNLSREAYRPVALRILRSLQPDEIASCAEQRTPEWMTEDLLVSEAARASPDYPGFVPAGAPQKTNCSKIPLLHESFWNRGLSE